MTAKAETKNDNQMTEEKASEFLQAQQTARLEQFAAKIDALMKENGYALIAVPYLDNEGRIRAQPRIVAV